jgi:predicted dehydrogenase
MASNLEEYLAGTDPTDPQSRFAIIRITTGRPDGTLIEWSSVEGQLYSVERSTALGLRARGPVRARAQPDHRRGLHRHWNPRGRPAQCRGACAEREGGGGQRRLRAASPEGPRAQPEPGGQSLRGLSRAAGRSAVDAVVIATPDHWHCQMVLDAVKAGKDIYCEKGFSRTLAEAKRMRDALKQSKVVFQLGHQARQATCALQAKELIARGILGPITLVRTGRFKSTEPNRPNWRWYGYYDQWDRPDPEQVRQAVNWDLWLGPAPKIPWNERHFWHWRCYYAYGTGYAGDLLSHEMDFVQYLLGHGIPDTCVSSGLIALLRDDREVPDTWVGHLPVREAGPHGHLRRQHEHHGQQPVTICGRDATLRFDAIAHDVTTVRDHPGRPQPEPRPAQRLCARPDADSSPITWWIG